jgi:hypothetical protein
MSSEGVVAKKRCMGSAGRRMGTRTVDRLVKGEGADHD